MKNENQLFTRLFALTLFVAFPLQSIFSQALTSREVFDFHPGDEMGIYTNYYNSLKGPHEYKFIKVIDRKDYGTDSFRITYFMARQFYKNFDWPTERKTFSMTYKNLDKPYFNRFRDKDTIYPLHRPSDTIKDWQFNYVFKDSIYTDSCNTQVNWRHESFSTPLSGGWASDSFAFKGLGCLTHFSNSDIFLEEREYFVYYIKNGIRCGKKEGFPLSVENLGKRGSVTITPIPAKEYLTVDAPGNYSYTITDLNGRTVAMGCNDPGATIATSSFPAGMYFICVLYDGLVYNQKIIISP